jgi:hypothetical protein
MLTLLFWLVITPLVLYLVVVLLLVCLIEFFKAVTG